MTVMPPREWRSARSSRRLRRRTSDVSVPTRAMSSSCSADVPAVTASAAPPAPPSLTPSSLSTPAVPRSRRVMLPKSANSRDCSATPKRRSSSSAATTSAPAVSRSPSANSLTALRSTSTKSRRSTKALTVPNSPSPSLRSVWRSSSSRRTSPGSRNWPLRKTSSPLSWPR